MAFLKKVERWRALAELHGSTHGVPVELLLAVIQRESGGDPTVKSGTGYRGLGQVGWAAWQDATRGLGVSWPYSYALDADRGSEQLQVVAWLLALHGRKTMKRAGVLTKWDEAHVRWADIRYGAGGGSLDDLLRRARKAGVPLTLAALATAYPHWMKPNIRPWVHSAAVWALVEAERAQGEGSGGAAPLPFPPLEMAVVAIVVVALIVALAANVRAKGSE